MEKIGLLIFLVVFTISIKAETPSEDKIECTKISKSCSICSDGTKRDPKDQKKILEMSDYACAKGDSSHDKKPRSFMDKDTCINLSAFCSICADQKFRFVQKDDRYKNLQEISSDLYECATEPRTKIY